MEDEAHAHRVILTIGHGARPIDDVTAALGGADVRRLVDVRTVPGSRRHPQFRREALSRSLEEIGIAYEWCRDLGGFRAPRADSPHNGLTVAAFRGYADHMGTRAFRDALDWLIRTSAAAEPTAIMCAESDWHRCHRRMIADALCVRDQPVRHILVGGRIERHTMHPSARPTEDGGLVYDVPPRGQGRLLEE